MAIDVNWVSGVIYVPKTYMTLIQASPEVRGLDIDLFRHDLKDLEASVVGALYPDTHSHAAETVIAGITYARGVIIKAPYTVEFEDDTYEVRPSGANHNLVDRRVWNQVSLTTQNSAGLVNNPAPSAVADAVLSALAAARATVAAGSTSTEVRTNLTQATGYFDGLLVMVVNSSGVGVRRASRFENTNGAFFFDEALPFTPAPGDALAVMVDFSSRFGSL